MEKSLKIDDKKGSEEHLTDEERRQLLSALHSRLFWVGQRIPDHVEFDGKTYPLHNYVWDLIQKDTLTEAEKSRIDKCIDIISAKEKEDEKELEEKPLTQEEAKTLYHETAGLLRAIMDLEKLRVELLKRVQDAFRSSSLIRESKMQSSGLSLSKMYLSEEPEKGTEQGLITAHWSSVKESSCLLCYRFRRRISPKFLTPKLKSISCSNITSMDILEKCYGNGAIVIKFVF